MATAFDVWLVAANTVYKGVPYGVVTGWAEQGRLGADDKVRPAGVNSPWVRAADHPLIADFLFDAPPAPVAAEAPTVPIGRPAPREPGGGEPLDLDVEPAHRRHGDEDEDVDMIPLIDVSLVLLIFFMLTSSVASSSPVPVPEMKKSMEIRGDPTAITVQIDQRATKEVIYAIRVGEAVAPEDNNILTLADALSKLRSRVAASEKPEVRIACNKELPRARVREVAKELDKLKKDNKIAFYGAEVSEAPK